MTQDITEPMAKPKDKTMIDIETDVREMLVKLKVGRDTYNDVIRRLVQEHYKKQK